MSAASASCACGMASEGVCANCHQWATTPEDDRLRAENARLAADNARLRAILDHPDPHDFVKATEVEARFQMDLWGTEEGFPTAFDGQDDHHFAYLIGYLTGKVVASNEGLEKKLHRITTIGAAAANWHLVAKARA